MVSPSGESLLVDTGYVGFNDRDADRIAAAAKQAGVSRIDYLVVTHYHADHVGGVPALAARLPIRTFVDHGPTVEEGERPAKLYNDYLAVRAKARHILARPGDTLPIAGINVQFVSAAGEVIKKPLAGAGAPNPLCRDFTAKPVDPTENARSVCMVLTFGSFRMLDLGDLTWNKEHDLVCPNNLLGAVDLYLTTHWPRSVGAAVLVHAARRAVDQNNGAKKGGMASAGRSSATRPASRICAAAPPVTPAPRPTLLFIANATKRRPTASASALTRRPLHRHQHPQRHEQDLPAPRALAARP